MTSLPMIRRRPWGTTEAWLRYATVMIQPDFTGDADYGPMWAGTSVSVVNDVKPAAEIVWDLARDADTMLRAQAPAT